MIQRIQTLWLLLSAIVSIYLVKGPIMKFKAAGEEFYTIGFTGVALQNGDKIELLKSSVAIPVVIVLIAVISLITVFLFRAGQCNCKSYYRLKIKVYWSTVFIIFKA